MQKILKHQTCVRAGMHYTHLSMRSIGKVEGDERGQDFAKNKTKTEVSSPTELIRCSCLLRSLWPLV